MRRVFVCFADPGAMVRYVLKIIRTLGSPLFRPFYGQTDNGSGVKQQEKRDAQSSHSSYQSNLRWKCLEGYSGILPLFKAFVSTQQAGDLMTTSGRPHDHLDGHRLSLLGM